MHFLRFEVDQISCLGQCQIDGQSTLYNVGNRKNFAVMLSTEAKNIQLVLSEVVRNKSFSIRSYFKMNNQPHNEDEVEAVNCEFSLHGFRKLAEKRLFVAELYTKDRFSGLMEPVEYLGADPVKINQIWVNIDLQKWIIMMQVTALSSNIPNSDQGLYVYVKIRDDIINGEQLCQPLKIGPLLVTSRPKNMKKRKLTDNHQPLARQKVIDQTPRQIIDMHQEISSIRQSVDHMAQAMLEFIQFQRLKDDRQRVSVSANPPNIFSRLDDAEFDPFTFSH